MNCKFLLRNLKVVNWFSFTSFQYAKYMEKHNTEIVRNIFKRACNIHLPRKATIHLEWAAFEERKGQCINAVLVPLVFCNGCCFLMRFEVMMLLPVIISLALDLRQC